jgi:hypothetical protein
VVYTSPEGESLFRKLLANWGRFLHDAEEVDPLIRLAVAHYQFEAIHPFTDGNGRAEGGPLPAAPGGDGARRVAGLDSLYVARGGRDRPLDHGAYSCHSPGTRR